MCYEINQILQFDLQVDKEEGDGAKSQCLGSMCMFPLSTLSYALYTCKWAPL